MTTMQICQRKRRERDDDNENEYGERLIQYDTQWKYPMAQTKPRYRKE